MNRFVQDATYLKNDIDVNCSKAKGPSKIDRVI